jgi:hypothetical protein
VTGQNLRGSATALKRGIDVGVTAGSVNIQFCSLHDFLVATSLGINMTGATGTGLTFSNNVTFSINGAHFQNVINTGSSILDTNIFMYQAGTTYLAILGDIGGTFSNMTLIGGNFGPVNINELNGVFGTYNNIIMHSCGNGISFGAAGISGSLTTLTLWRNANGALALSNYVNDLTITDLVAFGNVGNSVSLNGALGKITIIGMISNGDTSFATTQAINPSTSCTGELVIINGNFSTVSGIKTAHTNDVNMSTGPLTPKITFINTKLGGATEVLNYANMTKSGIITSQKNDQTSGQHKTWKKYGTIVSETTTVHTGGQSVKMTPNNATNKLESSGAFGGFKVAVANGSTVTPTVYVFEETAYNGNRARLILKRNDAIGITSDTVLATHVGVHDNVWESMSGTTSSATDDGTMEFVIDCDGTAGNVYIDSFSVV